MGSVRTALFDDHIKLAIRFARQFRQPGIDDDDLDQVSQTALWESTEGYDPAKYPGVPFWAYARERVRHALIRAVTADRAHGLTGGPGGVSFRSLPDCVVEPGGARPDRMADAVWEALARLDQFRQRLLIRRTGLDGEPAWTVFECAHRLGISVTTAKRFLAEARAEVGAELRRAGWDPSRWLAPPKENTRIRVS